MSPHVPATPTFHVTPKLAVAARGAVPVARLIEAFRIDPLARRPRI